MRKFIWLPIVLTLILAVSLTFAAKPVLRVGTDATYEPFETVDKDGKYVGFDMELIKMVADQMGMELQMHNIGWDGIIPGLLNGNYDCLISSMTITPERKKQINFSIPYFSTQQAIVVKASNNTIKTPNDLIGKTITVQNGTTGDIKFASNIKNAKVKRFDTNPQAVQELLNNNCDAAVMDDLVAYNAVRKTSGLKVIEIKNVQKEDYGIGIKKSNTQLLSKINKAITTLKQNGKLTALVNKYKTGK
ncbi:MAG TPA: basic amino acid ABC transporter substrate-binding protein [Bacillota bacterium]|nr:basic amino acid ABC transporter substrate-binding protein [Bacillota bacterium]